MTIDQRNKNKDIIMLILLSSVLIFVDWRLNSSFTFSDVILILLLILVIVRDGINIRLEQVLGYFALIVIVFLNISFNVFASKSFIVLEGMKGLIKVIFYGISTILIYNFIKQRKLEYQLLLIIEKTALGVCLIGIYIYIALQFKGILPYDIFWKFTRTDIASYTYGGIYNMIRLRSIFAEPAHLGYYLNAVLAISYFNKVGFQISKGIERIIVLSLILSFSMSSIIVLAEIKILELALKRSLTSVLRKKSTIFGMSILIIVLVLMRNVVQVTLLSRFGRIASGVDSSAYVRIFGSWSHVSLESLIFGVGIGNSPILFNNYSYVLTDLGIVSFFAFILFSLALAHYNLCLATIFIVLNFAKGGYLGPGYWVLVMLIILFSLSKGRLDDIQRNSQTVL